MLSSETAEISKLSDEVCLQSYIEKLCLLNYSQKLYVIANIIVTCSSLCQCFICWLWL